VNPVHRAVETERAPVIIRLRLDFRFGLRHSMQPVSLRKYIR
jgi:hypothetical protein